MRKFFVTVLLLLPGLMLMIPVNIRSAHAFGKPEIHGFFELDAGGRIKNDTTKHTDYNLLEQRLQLKTSYYPEKTVWAQWDTEISLKGDFLVDWYYDGKTDFQLREANVLFSPASWTDIKVGRQVFTWGTGDYLFINDLFPKDYESFYIGRDDEYLKKPSDGARISLYSDSADLDIVAIPLFEPNSIPRGERLSFLDTFQGGIAGRESDRSLIEPPRQTDNTELAMRLYKNIQSYEAAAYFFRGFYKMPRGYKNEALRQLFYPRLNVYGLSLRGPALGGISNIEIGYYDSMDDTQGSDRTIENSAFKAMTGYERDLGGDLRVGLQYLYEQILDYDNYKAALLNNDFFWDEHRHLLALRISRLLMSQTVKLSLFSFYSPSDEDVYLRPALNYNITDRWKITLGANLVWGKDDHTELGQMERNSNIYTRVRYSF